MTRRRVLAYNPPSAGERIFVADQQGGISYSDDNGETWTRKTVSGAPTWIYDLARGQDGVICAVGVSGSSTTEIMRSTDDGESYSLVDISGYAAGTLRSVFTDGAGKWFAQGDNNTADLYGSTDNGASWAKVADLGTGGTYARWAGAYHNGLYILAARGDNYWTSTNGTSWTRRTDMGANVGTVYRLKFVNGLWWACGQNRLAYSATGTGSWTEVNVGLQMRDIVHDGSVYIASGASTNTSTGVWKSTDGSSWTFIKALTGFTFWGLHVTQTGRLVVSAARDAYTQGVIQITDNLYSSQSQPLNSLDYNYTRLCC